MLRDYAPYYIQLGQLIADIRANLKKQLNVGITAPTNLKAALRGMKIKCDEAGFSESSAFLDKRINDLPTTEREFNMLVDVITAEISKELFLHVPSYRAMYYERAYSLRDIKIGLHNKFPQAHMELSHAGRCYAFGEYTASVFHSMCAVESGLRAMAVVLNIVLPHPIELAEWKTLIDKIEAKIKEMEGLPKGADKDEKVAFYSNAASQFRYFRDAYRNHVAHARKSYEEDEAQSILDRTREFLESLAPKLSEPDTP